MIEVVIIATVHARRDWLEKVLRAEASVHMAGVATTFPFLRSLVRDTTVDCGIVDITPTPESEIVHDWLLDLMEVCPVVALSPSSDPWLFNTMLGAERGALL